MRDVVFTPLAFDQYTYWADNNKKKFNKINKLIKEITRNPFSGTGKPEPLKENYSGCWSRRIDKGHRIVYRVFDDKIAVISCRYHY